jgi:hypothetical protein
MNPNTHGLIAHQEDRQSRFTSKAPFCSSNLTVNLEASLKPRLSAVPLLSATRAQRNLQGGHTKGNPPANPPLNRTAHSRLRRLCSAG